MSIHYFIWYGWKILNIWWYKVSEAFYWFSLVFYLFIEDKYINTVSGNLIFVSVFACNGSGHLDISIAPFQCIPISWRYLFEFMMIPNLFLNVFHIKPNYLRVPRKKGGIFWQNKNNIILNTYGITIKWHYMH